MLVTLLGIAMLVKLLPVNAFSPIFVTLFGIEVLLQPETRVFVAVSMIALQLFRLSYFVLFSLTKMLARLLQQKNAICPICVTLLGIMMLVRMLPVNA